jgi:hypothetical protein
MVWITRATRHFWRSRVTVSLLLIAVMLAATIAHKRRAEY